MRKKQSFICRNNNIDNPKIRKICGKNVHNLNNIEFESKNSSFEFK